MCTDYLADVLLQTKLRRKEYTHLKLHSFEPGSNQVIQESSALCKFLNNAILLREIPSIFHSSNTKLCPNILWIRHLL